MDNQQPGSASKLKVARIISSVPRTDKKKAIGSEAEAPSVSDVSLLVQPPTMHQPSIFNISDDDEPEVTSTTSAPLCDLQTNFYLHSSGPDDLPDVEWPDLALACDTPLPPTPDLDLGLESYLHNEALYQQFLPPVTIDLIDLEAFQRCTREYLKAKKEKEDKHTKTGR